MTPGSKTLSLPDGGADPDHASEPSQSHPRCKACRRHIDDIARLAASGGHIEQARIHVNSGGLVTGTFRVKSDFVVRLVVSQEPVVLVQSGGASSIAAPKLSKSPTVVFMSWKVDHWVVVEQGNA